MTNSKSIVLHDYFESAEGGGRLSKILSESLGADLAYGFRIPDHPYFHHHRGQYWDLKSYSRLPLWRQLKLIHKFQRDTVFVKHYEWAVFSGFYSPLAVLRHPAVHNVLYCHTPPRFVYDQRDFYLSQLPLWQRPLLQSFINVFRPRYEKAVARMDRIVANSNTVQDRIRRYLGKESLVIHPPCDTERFRWLGQENYYLSTARLDPLKRIDRLIQAFQKMPDQHLIIISSGSEFKRLQRMANGIYNITFTGWVDEQKLHELLGNAIATLYIPKDEDFGMSPVESMASGKPVIGAAEGGLRETVVHNKTGVLLPPEPTVDGIIAAVQFLTPKRALSMRRDCEAQARHFSKQLFIEKMQRILKR